ncbi:DUF1593 domain-containing protein [Marinilabilia sp.]|uniref:DUF1593 domain-containing protein n=1 Tax=Marinilabilia sp. TaxID=2021252 RepID=UPI0025C59F19|nr:nucleoside hydrolase-like domain-containing protein [Marinilabilia sp.]
MKKNWFLLILAILIIQGAASQKNQLQQSDSSALKPRIVVLTDISTWEPDDSESLVRLLVNADLFEIEGLIYTTGWSLEETRDDFLQLIHDRIDAYEKDLPNLMKRSAQTDFKKDESKQKIGYWPSPEYLRARTMVGSKKRGMEHIGEDNISDGSNLIINQAGKNDDRPLWILLWGGGNTLAQAIWQVQEQRDENALRAFLHKIPTYAITDQDRSYKSGTPYNISSQQWIRTEFEKDLMYFWDECAWKFQNGTGRKNWDEYAQHIQSKGNLGKQYPKYKYGVEGDTPSFLHIIPNGLNNWLAPNQAGWGGYFEWGIGPDSISYAYTNHKGKAFEICTKYEDLFYPATFNDFVARMDWADCGEGNRNPEIMLNGNKDFTPLHISRKPGKQIKLDGSKSFDPDGDQLNFKWWVMPESGTYNERVTIPENHSSSIIFTVPKGSQGQTFHVICEVTDNGEPQLTRYRRIIVHSTSD